MGTGMAHSWLRGGFAVQAWNRTRARAEPLAAFGATVFDRPEQALQDARVVVTMLADGEITAQVARTFLAYAPTDLVWVQMGTVGLAATAALAAQAQAARVPFVDAPVLGTKQPAETGALTILAAGPGSLRPTLEPIFAAIGQRTLWLDEEPGRASALKLVINGYLGALIASVAESLAFAGSLGLDPELFLDTIKGGGMDCAYTQLKGHAMLEHDYATRFPASLTAKDLRLVVEAAQASGLQPEMAAAAGHLFSRTTALGHGEQDMAAVYEAARASAAPKPRG